MEILNFFGGGTTFIIGIALLVLIFRTRMRVRTLERLMEKLIKTGGVWRATEQNYQFQTQTQQVDLRQTIPSPSPEVLTPPEQLALTSFDKFLVWLKEDWLLKIGALLLIIGFGWFASYAFIHNWIGPMGRIALGVVAGALFLLLGWWRIKKSLSQGGVFLVLGSTTILLTVFAARAIYNFFDPVSALVVMFLSVAFVAFVGVKHNSRALTLMSLALASVAPLLIKPPDTDHIGLFAYLFFIALGAVWVVAINGQRTLTTVALVIISLYSLPHLLSPSLFPQVVAGNLLFFAYAFAALFFITNTAGILKLKDKDKKEIIPDLVTAAGNGLFLLFWIMSAAPKEWQSLIISAWMILFAAGSFIVFKITQKREPFYVYAGVAVAMLAAATFAELEGAALTIAYTIESGIISFVAYSIIKDARVAERISLLLIGPIFLSFGSIASRSWRTSVFNEDFFVLLVLGVTLFGLGLFFRSCRAAETDEKDPKRFNAALLIAGSVYGYALVWLSLHSMFQEGSAATMISLVIYLIIGLITYFNSLANDKKTLRIYGGLLVGFVVGHLLFVDVWHMELAQRTATFFLIGALLVSTAFLSRKKRFVKQV